MHASLILFVKFKEKHAEKVPFQSEYSHIMLPSQMLLFSEIYLDLRHY